MRVDVRVQRAAIPNFVLKPQFTAQAGVLSNDRRVSFAGQVTSNAAKWESEKKDSSIYDFSTYAEGEEGVRLLIRNGFDGMDLWLVSKGRQGERHPLRIHGNGERIKSQDRYGPFWSGVPSFVFTPAMFFSGVIAFVGLVVSALARAVAAVGTGAGALGAALTRVSVSTKQVFNRESARKTGPHILMMHGNSVEAGKAHGVLVERTNGLIEECLRFR
jgi:hypothetical protein